MYNDVDNKVKINMFEVSWRGVCKCLFNYVG